MSLNFELRRAPRHAIGEFTATVQLFQSIGAETFSSVVSTLRTIAAELGLPASMPIQVFQFALGAAEGVTLPTPPPTGIGFQRFAPNGEVEASLLCDSDSIVFSLRDYVAWEEVRPTLIDTFAKLLEQYLLEVPAIKSIRLQYLNEFQARSPKTLSAAELFRSDSLWLAPFAYGSSDPWHCHIGQYLPVDESRRMLVNINCDVSRMKSARSDDAHTYAKVLIVAGCFYNVPGGSPLIVDTERLRDALFENLEGAHKLEKDMLRQIMSVPYLEAMGALDAAN
jgi:uncharacterized protein (TIGR04255 family)